MYSDYTAAVQRAKARWGEQFSDAGLATKFARYFNGPRIEVTTTYDDGTAWTRRGRVGITTGRQPVLILLPRIDSTGSSDILHDTDIITTIS